MATAARMTAPATTISAANSRPVVSLIAVTCALFLGNCSLHRTQPKVDSIRLTTLPSSRDTSSMSAIFRRPLTPKAGNRPRAIPFRSDVGQLQRDLVGYSLELFCQFILRAGCDAENFLCRSVLRMSRLPRRPSGLLTERCRSVDQLLESELQAGIGHDAEGSSGWWQTSKSHRGALDGERFGCAPHMLESADSSHPAKQPPSGTGRQSRRCNCARRAGTYC